MEYVCETRGLAKRFGDVAALDGVTLGIRRGSIVGLVGKNGSGKTTLLRHLVGLYLPTEGEVETLGRASGELGHDELASIGFVPQEIRLLDWMTVEQHLRYVATFYPRWDRQREERLCRELELAAETRVGALSAGNLQKLALVLALCHHPRLLLLDEPASDLDPLARARLLEFLLEVVRDDEATIVISSHVLRDVERVVDWILCLEAGRITTDAALDDLKDLYAEWHVTSPDGALPASFPEAFILEQEVRGREARLLVRRGAAELEVFGARYGAEVVSRPLSLEALFPLLIREGER